MVFEGGVPNVPVRLRTHELADPDRRYVAGQTVALLDIEATRVVCHLDCFS